jgi:hypothetical protein
MSAMLNDAGLPLKFWDESVTADIYLRNRTNTEPIIDGKTISPEGAWIGVTPSIDHIECGEVSGIHTSILTLFLMASAMRSL